VLEWHPSNERPGPPVAALDAVAGTRR
jgi:hypothetical protein